MKTKAGNQDRRSALSHVYTNAQNRSQGIDCVVIHHSNRTNRGSYNIHRRMLRAKRARLDSPRRKQVLSLEIPLTSKAHKPPKIERKPGMRSSPYPKIGDQHCHMSIPMLKTEAKGSTLSSSTTLTGPREDLIISIGECSGLRGLGWIVLGGSKCFP
jgi:hypothetical protein